MSFSEILKEYDFNKVKEYIYSQTNSHVEEALSAKKLNNNHLLSLLSPAAKNYLEEMAQIAQKITLSRFGKTIKIYAPMYLSNDCVNSCLYCGFNRKTNIERISLTADEIVEEAKILSSTGIKNVILVSGDNKKAFSNEDIVNAVKICSKFFPMVSVEVRALEEDDYKNIRNAGADGFTMFQETYNSTSYKELHPQGPKSNFEYRLNAPERAAKAGIRAIGLGALLGLDDFRTDVFFLSLHSKYLSEKYYKSHISASFPRIRNSAGCFTPSYSVTDADVLQSILAYRIFLNDAGINISTRETPFFRDKLISLGATIMSAGSKTEPKGYSKPNKDAGQFNIEDDRSVEEFVEAVKSAGYDPVLKDWDNGFKAY